MNNKILPGIVYPVPNGYVSTLKPTICGTGAPDAVVDEKKNAAKVSPQGTWSIEIGETLVEDIHLVSARQKDPAGNESPEKITLFTVKSKQPPVPVIESPKPGDFCREASPLISGRGELGCTIEAHVGERVFGAPVDRGGMWSFRVPMLLPEGANTIKLYQIDRAGNVSRNVDLSLAVDTKAPAPPSVVYPARDGYIVSPDFCAMTYSLSVLHVDTAVNQSPATRVDFRLDPNLLREPELTWPKNGTSVNTATPVLTGTGKVGASVSVNIKKETWSASVGSDGTWSLALQKPLCAGETVVNLCQTDAGNRSPVKTIRFSVVTELPQPPVIISPMENQIVGGPLVVSGSGLNGARVTLRLDDRTYTAEVKNGTWVLPVTEPVGNGIHSVLAGQTDAAGNKSRCAAVTFVYYSEEQSVCGTDSACNAAALPTYRLLYNPPGPEWSTETIVTLRSDAPLSVKNVCGTVFSAFVRKNGVYNIDYLDQNGCAGSVTAAVTWVDGTLPVIVLQSAGNPFSSEKTVQYFKPCGAGLGTALLNGVPFESGRTVAEEGIYQVEVRDQAGNVAREQFFIDTTPPLITGVENGKVYRNDVTLRFSDNLSGVQSAVLNGKNILSCAVVSADDDYTLKVTDHGGNAAEVRFHIQK
jgi:hypothetical protein